MSLTDESAKSARTSYVGPDRRRLLSMALLLGGLCACGREGVSPTPSRLIFPIDVALSQPTAEGEPSRFLFVASSNFDLRFNAGILHTLDLEAVRTQVEACGGETPCEIPLENASPPLIVSEVEIGSFASQIEVAPTGDRLYVTIRSDANVTTVDVDENGQLACGGSFGERHRCERSFERLDESVIRERGLRLPADPVALSLLPVGALPNQPEDAPEVFMFIAHRDGALSVSVDPRDGRPPIVLDVLDNLSSGLEGLGVETTSAFAWMPSAFQSRVERVGVTSIAGEPDLRSSRLYSAGTFRFEGIDTGQGFRGDTRTIAFDPRPELDRAYLLARRPEAVLVADLEDSGPDGVLDVTDVMGTCVGPSRLKVESWRGRVVGFVSCFDGRALQVFDLEARQLLGVAKGMSGVFQMAVDLERDLVYVADFGVSTVRVISLAPLVACLEGESGTCSPEVVATLGTPQPVEDLN